MAGPSYMSDSQMSSYLQNLRSNRPARPTGSRPPPPSSTNRRSMVDERSHDSKAPRASNDDHASRSSSALSYYYDSASSNASSHRNSLVRPSSKDPRRLERRESRALRLAMEDLDGKERKDGAQVYDAAKAEVEELLRGHQSPRNTLVLEHRPNHAREDSLDLDSLLDDYEDEPTLHEDKPIPPPAPRARFVEPKRDSSSSDDLPPDLAVRKMSSRGWLSRKKSPDEDPAEPEDISISRRLSQKLSFSNLAGKRKSSGTRKTSSRKASASTFPNETEKIYEDPVEPVIPPPSEEPKPFAGRRNPFQRYQSTRDATAAEAPAPASRPIHRQEIWRNDPSQSRDPGYTRNTALPSPPALERQQSQTQMRDGSELRSEDIRAATSKRLGDRSQKLPSPTAVGDRSRPIVSFDPHWKPPEKQDDPSQSQSQPSPVRRFVHEQASASNVRSNSAPVKPAAAQKKHEPTESANYPSIYKLLGEEEPEVKGIARVASGSLESHSGPVAKVPEPPTILVDEPESDATPSRPEASGLPSFSITSDEDLETKSAASGPKTRASRPLPVHAATAPEPASHRRDPFTPMHTRRAGLCAQCALPISGRIVTAAGTRFHPECFKCFHCSEALECVAFYPEPAEKREERLNLIARRAAGEDVRAGDANQQDDEDDGLRFYCHLDYHELFSPRCKSCKTPIEGEVVVACGAEWHVGHFFCAQCGDPFDPTIPFVEKDGYAWCVKCHTNRFSAKCRKCRRPVTDTVVKALGAEWHVGCFCCGECGKAFDDGHYFVREPEEGAAAGQGVVVCSACEERRLKA